MASVAKGCDQVVIGFDASTLTATPIGMSRHHGSVLRPAGLAWNVTHSFE
jgi:hypothetical protein